MLRFATKYYFIAMNPSVTDSEILSYQLRVTSGRMVNYCYILVNHTSAEAILIDPAWNLVQISQQLQALNVKLKAILVTHAHFDHVHLAAPLAHYYRIPVFMSSAAAARLTEYIPSLQTFTSNCTLVLAGMQIKVLLTPGHSVGSTCYFCHNYLYTGDTLFIEGCGTCSDGEFACRQLYDSLQELKQLVPPHMQVCAGHCFSEQRTATFAEVSHSNVYLQFSNYKQFRDFRLRPNQQSLMAFM